MAVRANLTLLTGWHTIAASRFEKLAAVDFRALFLRVVLAEAQEEAKCERRRGCHRR
jgi:hypothetical protein